MYINILLVTVLLGLGYLITLLIAINHHCLLYSYICFFYDILAIFLSKQPKLYYLTVETSHCKTKCTIGNVTLMQQ